MQDQIFIKHVQEEGFQVGYQVTFSCPEPSAVPKFTVSIFQVDDKIPNLNALAYLEQGVIIRALEKAGCKAIGVQGKLDQMQVETSGDARAIFSQVMQAQGYRPSHVQSVTKEDGLEGVIKKVLGVYLRVPELDAAVRETVAAVAAYRGK